MAFGADTGGMAEVVYMGSGCGSEKLGCQFGRSAKVVGRGANWAVDVKEKDGMWCSTEALGLESTYGCGGYCWGDVCSDAGWVAGED